MSEPVDDVQAFVFKNRGALLAIPAVALAAFGKPSALSVTIGLPIAIAGELVRCWAVGYSGVTHARRRRQRAGAGYRGAVRVRSQPALRGQLPHRVGLRDRVYRKKPSRGARGVNRGFARRHGGRLLRRSSRTKNAFCAREFGEAFERYCERVPPVVPQLEPMPNGTGTWRPAVIKEAESKHLLDVRRDAGRPRAQGAQSLAHRGDDAARV